MKYWKGIFGLWVLGWILFAGFLWYPINAIDSSLILPGDMAVTANGIHILAYIGENRWIEADPGVEKVIVVEVPDETNHWFNTPVVLIRWNQLTPLSPR